MWELAVMEMSLLNFHYEDLLRPFAEVTPEVLNRATVLERIKISN